MSFDIALAALIVVPLCLAITQEYNKHQLIVDTTIRILETNTLNVCRFVYVVGQILAQKFISKYKLRIIAASEVI